MHGELVRLVNFMGQRLDALLGELVGSSHAVLRFLHPGPKFHRCVKTSGYLLKFRPAHMADTNDRQYKIDVNFFDFFRAQTASIAIPGVDRRASWI